MISQKYITYACFLIIVGSAIGTKLIALNHWQEQGLTSIFPWYIPYIFILWSFALMFRLYQEKSRLFSVWIMALALLWYGVQLFAYSG